MIDLVFVDGNLCLIMMIHRDPSIFGSWFLVDGNGNPWLANHPSSTAILSSRPARRDDRAAVRPLRFASWFPRAIRREGTWLPGSKSLGTSWKSRQVSIIILMDAGLYSYNIKCMLGWKGILRVSALGMAGAHPLPNNDSKTKMFAVLEVFEKL